MKSERTHVCNIFIFDIKIHRLDWKNNEYCILVLKYFEPRSLLLLYVSKTRYCHRVELAVFRFVQWFQNVDLNDDYSNDINIVYV